MSQPQHDQGRGPNLVGDIESASSLLRWLVSSLAVMTYPFTRANFGRDYFGFQTILGLVLLWMYSSYTSPRDAIPCVLFTVAFFGMLAHHRIRYFFKGAGKDEHSRYNGTPYARLDGTSTENTAKLVIEPFVVTCVGLLIASLWSSSLGTFLLACAAAGLLEHVVYLRQVQQQAQVIRDAEISQGIVLDHFDQRFRS